MKRPQLSKHFKKRLPSAIRSAQIAFSERKDKEEIQVINLAIGNISLPMYPAMLKKMKQLGTELFSDGVVKYTSTVGTENARKGFLNILEASKIDTSNLFVNITDGGSSSMELMMLGTSGPSSDKPIMLVDPAYTNYLEFAKRLNIPVITSNRKINRHGRFEKLDLSYIEKHIRKHKPASIIVIPYDNPTGQFLSQNMLIAIGKICVKHNIWFVSDEAYRPLFYLKEKSSSIWKITEKNVPGITGFRISIESASKVWNACGLRIGGIITDNENFHQKVISEYTANLCANTIGQEIFGVLANEPHHKILKWYDKQINYYKSILKYLELNLSIEIPGLIVTKPEAAIYFVIDFKNICSKNFDAQSFVEYCALKGKIEYKDMFYTLLLAPMEGFYSKKEYGKTQLRMAIVESEEIMKKVPKILGMLFGSYENK